MLSFELEKGDNGICWLIDNSLHELLKQGYPNRFEKRGIKTA